MSNNLQIAVIEDDERLDTDPICFDDTDTDQSSGNGPLLRHATPPPPPPPRRMTGT